MNMARTPEWKRLPAKSLNRATYGRIVYAMRHKTGALLLHRKPVSRNCCQYRTIGLWLVLVDLVVVRRKSYHNQRPILRPPVRWANKVLRAHAAGVYERELLQAARAATEDAARLRERSPLRRLRPGRQEQGGGWIELLAWAPQGWWEPSPPVRHSKEGSAVHQTEEELTVQETALGNQARAEAEEVPTDVSRLLIPNDNPRDPDGLLYFPVSAEELPRSMFPMAKPRKTFFGTRRRRGSGSHLVSGGAGHSRTATV